MKVSKVKTSAAYGGRSHMEELRAVCTGVSTIPEIVGHGLVIVSLGVAGVCSGSAQHRHVYQHPHQQASLSFISIGGRAHSGQSIIAVCTNAGFFVVAVEKQSRQLFYGWHQFSQCSAR